MRRRSLHSMTGRHTAASSSRRRRRPRSESLEDRRLLSPLPAVPSRPPAIELFEIAHLDGAARKPGKQPVLSIGDATVTTSSEDRTVATFTLTLSRPRKKPVVVDYSTA